LTLRDAVERISAAVEVQPNIEGWSAFGSGRNRRMPPTQCFDRYNQVVDVIFTPEIAGELRWASKLEAIRRRHCWGCRAGDVSRCGAGDSSASTVMIVMRRQRSTTFSMCASETEFQRRSRYPRNVARGQKVPRSRGMTAYASGRH